mmetsp:Transcript_21265/g.52679  ORF Transcript_21265/g.52679 Transcript_21265/m.52679 type:complete len:357 (+) Transcript_21265:132-1202(+)
MKRCSTSTFCNLVLIGACLPWDCVGDEVQVVAARRNVRRRTRFVAPRFDDTEDTLLALASLIREDEDFASRVSSYSMPKNPTTPTKPPGREDRDILIQNKCGVTAIERSRDILTELLTVSDASALTNPYTSQFKAREWVDKNDPAIICSMNKKRIDQRYRLALLYYELGGSSWTRCKAEDDVDDSTEEECPGNRFLDKSNECEWYGMICGDSFNVATAEWMDAYYPLEVLDLQSNNLSGKLYKEFYDFPKLKEIFLNDNSLSGTISEEIGNFQDVTVLQLDSNSFDGSIPEQGLFEMKKLAGLSIQENDVQGSLDELCDVMYDRRFEFESYLTLKMEADCLGNSPKVYCECCSTCH